MQIYDLFTFDPTFALDPIYSLFKQATLGDVVGDRPGGFDFKAFAKYNAWANIKGKDKDECMQDYINLISSLS